MKYRGIGTEQVERALHAIFPDIRTIRIDADTTRHKGSHQKLLRDFATGKADILIGTQMIAKGLHFPEVTLVGVLNSDTHLNIPDFRSSETVFQLITQVAGRSGRGVLPGEVIIQTTVPENTTIQYASRQDYLSFYQEEISVRELFRYPPFIHLIKLNFSGKTSEETFATAENIRSFLLSKLPEDFEIHPVIPSGHARVKDLFRYQFLVKAPSIYSFNKEVELLLNEKSLPHSVRLFIDIDPSSTYF